MGKSVKSKKVITFIEHLTHSKAPWYGHPLRLMDWQKDFIHDLYGTIDKEGRRQYRQAFLFVGRKNGKTLLAAALALFHLLADGKPGNEVVLAAGSREQAGICFSQAADFVRMNRVLRKRCRVVDYKKTITDTKTGSILKTVSADGAMAHGLNPGFVVADELHVWTGQKGRDLWAALTTGSSTREEPLFLSITTAGVEQTSVAYEQYKYAKQVADGTVKDETFLPVLFEADEGDKWDDPATWAKANPAMGEFKNIEDIQAMANKARYIHSLRLEFERFHLNRWTGTATSWIDLAAWDATAGIVVPGELKGRVCYGGLDLSSTTDLSSLVLVFPDDNAPTGYDVLCHFWLPEERLESTEDALDYKTMARQGFLTTTPGNVIDYRSIHHTIKQVRKEYRLKELAFDRWNSSQLITELMDDGAPVVATGMGYKSMSAPSKHLEELILSKRIRHGGNPILRWNAAGCAIETDASENIKPTKKKSRHRIDGIVALILALSRAMLRERRESIYTERGLLSV